MNLRSAVTFLPTDSLCEESSPTILRDGAVVTIELLIMRFLLLDFAESPGGSHPRRDFLAVVKIMSIGATNVAARSPVL